MQRRKTVVFAMLVKKNLSTQVPVRMIWKLKNRRREKEQKP